MRKLAGHWGTNLVSLDAGIDELADPIVIELEGPDGILLDTLRRDA